MLVVGETIIDEYSFCETLGKSGKEPILAAVGQLQFEVVQYRLLSEYGAKTSCRRLPFKIAFWAEGPAINEEDFPSDAMMTLDSRGNRVLLFTSQWDADYFKRQNPTITLKTRRNRWTISTSTGFTLKAYDDEK